ncbi:hypothetical protein [Hydrogenimonas thermophila]|uniref:Uncharacterized protein n=1 Tax=Hydrogenimonas thermophila TaxID=223786 RepID=A0A1I5LXW3_9BACT|nr:hypothetical protein [Hydrogenimonas thermophila]SFP02070.1 hypothetical protein SAMN05216234_10470 [Hydrogenimonas thermophila]
MDRKNLALVDTKQINEMIDELRYLEGTLIPLLGENSSLIKRLENIAVQLDNANSNLDKLIGDKLNESLTDITMVNKLLFYTIVSDPEALEDSVSFAKKVKDKNFLEWLKQKGL